MRPYITPRWIPGIVGFFNLLIVDDGCYVGRLAVSLAAGRLLRYYVITYILLVGLKV